MMRWTGVILAVILFALPVEAKKYDLDPELAKLYNHYYVDVYPNETDQAALASTQAYRSLMSEYGVVMAPAFLAPAETVGYSGFALDLLYGFTTINSKSEYWKYGVAGGEPSSAMHTIGFQFRKGMWIPLPGFEMVGGFKYLTGSHLYTPYFMAKFALNEGFFDLIIPAFAVRAGIGRVMGSPDVALTIASFDGSISKSIGLGGTVNGQFYLGYNYLLIYPDSRVIDTTPDKDALGTPPDGGYPPGTLCTDDDCRNNIVFDKQSAIGRHRIMFGTKITYHVFTLGLESVWTLSGDSKDSAKVYDYVSSQAMDFNIKDDSSFQWSLYFTLGADW